MKNLLLLAFLFVASCVFGQNTDLIVTTKGDSITCAIQKITTQYIAYKKSQLYGDPLRVKIPLAEVAEYKRDFFEDYISSDKRSTGISRGWRLRVAADAGVFWNTANAGDRSNRLITEYRRDLSLGFQTGVQAHFLLTDDIGLGLYTNFSRASAALDNPVSINLAAINQPPRWVQTEVKEEISVTYLGPSIGGGTGVGRNLEFWASGSVGMFYLQNDFTFLGDGKITGQNFAWSWDLSADYKISENLALGFQVGQLIGFLERFEEERSGQVTQVTLENGNYISIVRINLSLGLHIFI